MRGGAGGEGCDSGKRKRSRAAGWLLSTTMSKPSLSRTLFTFCLSAVALGAACVEEPAPELSEPSVSETGGDEDPPTDEEQLESSGCVAAWSPRSTRGAGRAGARTASAASRPPAPPPSPPSRA